MINHLPQLKQLDGESIERSERLKAAQIAESVEVAIISASASYASKRAKQKEDYYLRLAPNSSRIL